jgi:hypothetical protein
MITWRNLGKFPLGDLKIAQNLIRFRLLTDSNA